GRIVGTSDQAIAYESVPPRLIVIGGGVIGLELGSVWNRLGAQVTVIEYLPRLLGGMDEELAAQAAKVFAAQGMTLRLGCRAQSARARGEVGEVVFLDENGSEQRLEAERALVAAGRQPYTEGLGLEEVGVRLDARGRVEVNGHFQTSVPSIYAIGDVIRGPMLAHKASDEGVAVVDAMVGRYAEVNYDAIPSIVYTDPEIASVGKTEEELRAAGIPYRQGTVPCRVSGRARAVAALAVAIDMMASAEDIARACHAHPTLSEVIREAALDVAGMALHK